MKKRSSLTKSQKKAELQVTKLSPLGYYNFTGDVLSLGKRKLQSYPKKK